MYVKGVTWNDKLTEKSPKRLKNSFCYGRILISFYYCLEPKINKTTLVLIVSLYCLQMWSSSWSRVPHPLLQLPPEPTLPGPAALLRRQRLRGPGLLPDDQGEASSAPGLLDHPWGHWSRTPPQQGGHRGPQPGSQTEAGLHAACDLRGSDSEPSRAGEAVWAVQHPSGEGMSGSTGILHDGDGTDTGGDAAPQSWREGPGAVLREHSHRLDTENSGQTYRVPTATAERHGEIILCIFQFLFTKEKVDQKGRRFRLLEGEGWRKKNLL